jgi:hypothetical protein
MKQAHANTFVTLTELVTWPPFVSVLKGIKFLFPACKKGLATTCKKSKKSAKI